MDVPKEVAERANGLLRAHFEALNSGNANLAKSQLFHPSALNRRPLDMYVDEMLRLAPFEVVGTETEAIWAPRSTQHGTVATVWVKILVNISSLGSTRSESAPVWWFPDRDELLLASRFSGWVLEHQGLSQRK